MNNSWLTVAEVAAKTGYSTALVYRLIDAYLQDRQGRAVAHDRLQTAAIPLRAGLGRF